MLLKLDDVAVFRNILAIKLSVFRLSLRSVRRTVTQSFFLDVVRPMIATPGNLRKVSPQIAVLKIPERPPHILAGVLF